MKKLLSLAFFLLLAISGMNNGQPALQTPVEVQASLSSAQTRMAVGGSAAWQLQILPAEGVEITSLAIAVPQRSDWELSQPTLPPVIAAPVAIELTLVAKRAGDLAPTIILNYQVDGRPSSLFVRAEQMVQVLPVEDLVAAELTLPPHPLQANRAVDVLLTIRNNSPFTLQASLIDPFVAGNQPPNPPTDLQPGESRQLQVQVSITTGQRYAQAPVELRWRDDRQNDYSTILTPQSEPISFSQSIWASIPTELLTVIAGVITGAGVAFATTLIGNLLNSRMQQAANRRRLHGMLDLFVKRARAAARDAQSIDLAPLEEIFTQETLYHIAEKDRLKEKAQQALEQGLLHNQGLNQVGSARRMDNFTQALDELEKHLKNLKAAEDATTPGGGRPQPRNPA